MSRVHKLLTVYYSHVDRVQGLIALSKCHNLTQLDLSRVYGPLFLPPFFKAISKLDKLKRLRFPRSFLYPKVIPKNQPMWPKNLVRLQLGGQIEDSALPYFSKFPPSLVCLKLRHWHFLTKRFIKTLVQRLGPQLKELSILDGINRITRTGFDGILRYTPSLRRLSLMTDNISGKFFDVCYNPNRPKFLTQSLPLVELVLYDFDTYPRLAPRKRFGSQTISLAVDQGRLDHLRKAIMYGNLHDRDMRSKDSDSIIYEWRREE